MLLLIFSHGLPESVQGAPVAAGIRAGRLVRSKTDFSRAETPHGHSWSRQESALKEGWALQPPVLVWALPIEVAGTGVYQI